MLVAVQDGDGAATSPSLAELRRLADACALAVAGVVVQTRARPDPDTYLSAGKVAELAVTAAVVRADVVIAEDGLSARQTRALEERTGVPVVDRATLILDIFDRHGHGSGVAPLCGVDRMPAVVLAGYTNAGKSALLNRLSGAAVPSTDVLFATLDPVVRPVRANGHAFALADTVGIVRHLPYRRVPAFRSTLDALRHADLTLHVVDAAAPDALDQISAVRDVRREIGAGHLPELLVLNKVDIARPAGLTALRRTFPDPVAVSARTGAGVPALLRAVVTRLRQVELGAVP